MKFLLIQISDIHARNADSGLVLARLEQVPEAVKHLDNDLAVAVVILSGDAAFSGTKAEYDAFENALKPMLSRFSSVLPGTAIHFIGVPGNHDSDFKHPVAQARRLLLESFSRSSSEPPEETTLDICCQPQSEFFSLLERRQTLKPCYTKSNAYYEYLIPVGDQQLLFRCLNTAFSSSLPEIAGQMTFPVAILQERAINPAPTYVIGVLHHPYNWFAPNIKRDLSERLERTCDLIFTGHEHVTAYYKREAFSGLVTDYVEGAVFHDHDSDCCGFNAALVNLETSHERLYSFEWATDHFAQKEITDGWRPFRRSRTRRDFELSDAMLQYLQDPGATFSHPAKPQLLLEDIFVPPNAQELTLKDGNDLVRKGNIASKDLLNFIANKHKLLIIGRERSGKSTLAKVLFRQFYHKDLVPILISGDEIRGPDLQKLIKLSEERLRQDYKNPLLDKFNQLNDDQVVLILDDFDHANLNARGRLKLLEGIHKRFRRVVILGDDLLRFEELACGQLGPQVLSEYTQIELMEYGHVLRSAIIDKWYDVNREYIANPDELERKVAKSENLIDDILGRSYLPSYPIFILTLLQGIDTSEPVDNSAGSYGYLYTVLITRQLAGGSKELSLDKKLAYLVELAFYMFAHKRRELSKPEFEVFHLRHCAQYVAMDRKLILKELDLAGIIELYHDHYRFKYTYFYYYFVAQHLTRHIDETDARTCIEELCRGLDREENANIWMFLTHQARSSFVLETIVKHATKFFASITPQRFEEDTQFLAKLYDKIPELVYVAKSTEELRQERRKLLDDQSKEDSTRQSEAEGTNALLELVANIRGALRTLEVMGQIVKNYAGSMKNDPKYLLVKQCYELGLRVVGVVFQMWQNSGQDLVEEVLDAVLWKEANIESKEELERLIKQFIFFFCETIAFNIIKRISHAVGTKDLSDIYEKALTDTPTNAYKLIDLSVKLDSVGFPTGDICDLSDQFKGHVFCTRLLSHLVIHHFYLFNTSEQTKQKICDKLGIKMQLLRGIDARTEAQKRVSDRERG